MQYLVNKHHLVIILGHKVILERRDLQTNRHRVFGSHRLDQLVLDHIIVIFIITLGYRS